MRPSGQSVLQQRTFARGQPRDRMSCQVVPFDYVADFKLIGNVGNLVQDVINISVDSVFVATAIGYGFDEDRAETLKLDTKSVPVPTKLGEITLANVPPDILIEGFRIDPNFAPLAVKNGQLNTELPYEIAQNCFQRLKQTDNFDFLLSLVDSASGRELQNEPVHNVATLGRADGKRPFKMLPQPMTFMPRSTIRLQVEERTHGAKGRLYITLQGYKILGAANLLEAETRQLGEFEPLQQIPVYDHESGDYRTLAEAINLDIPTTRIVPFDYVAMLKLEGKPGNIVEDEVPINIDGGYVTTALAYSLDVGDIGLEIKDYTIINPNGADLRSIKLTDIMPVQALLDGIRLHPLRVRFAIGSDGQLACVDEDMIKPLSQGGSTGQRVFQRLNRPEDVRFLYAISDSGTGRDLQNQPVHNIAGLGIATGDRPFKILRRPMVFLPRSTIRVKVEEIFGRGQLYFVFQGYKVLA